MSRTIDQVMRLYRSETAGTRAFLKGRVLLSDLGYIESQTPREGRIIDLGCGHGLFSNLLALSSAQRHVTGIDLDADKIAVARRTVDARANIDFICGDMLELGLAGCDAVTIVDVMYLIPPEQQFALLKKCGEVLAPGGRLVWKAQDRRPLWKYAITYGQELVTTSAGLTRGRHSASLHFLDRETALAALRRAGFEARAIPMKSWRPYTDVLYLGQKIRDVP